MARTEARIFTSIWREGDWRRLKQGEQWLYFSLLSQPDLSNCGVLPDTSQRWADLATDTTVKQVNSWRDGLVSGHFLVRDERTAELMVRTLVRNDGILKSANLTVNMARAFGAIHSDVLREYLVDELAKAFPEGILKGLAEAFDKGDRPPFVERLPEDFRDAVHTLCTPSPHHPITPPDAATSYRGDSRAAEALA